MAKRWEFNDGTISVAFKRKRHHIPTPTHTPTATHITHTYRHTLERIHKDTHTRVHSHTEELLLFERNKEIRSRTYKEIKRNEVMEKPKKD